jgi:hypothetical protein
VSFVSRDLEANSPCGAGHSSCGFDSSAEHDELDTVDDGRPPSTAD